MLMQPVRAPVLERAGVWPFVGAWLLASVIMIIAGWGSFGRFEFPDPDDALRLQQVRDWMAGQSWFDVTQYRLNPPGGVLMHWSRLVDVPIAAVIWLVRPFAGQAAAELTALIAVPLITLAVVMALVAKLTERLLDREHALLAALLTPVSVAVTAQLRPMRIDHHGWQIALGLVAVLAIMEQRQRRSGLIAGVAAALWLHISLEGLPFAVAVAALFALRWLIDSGERERLVSFVLALAGGSVALFAVTHPISAWSVSYCDSVSPAYLAGLAVGAVGTLAITGIRPLAGKLFGLSVIGIATAGAVVAVAPQCAAGPFASLDPLVRHFWYERVMEGQPIWRQSVSVAAMVIAFPIVGLIGTWSAWRKAEGRRRTEWALMLFLLVTAAAAAVMVQRAGALANMLALPGGVYLFEAALAKARKQQPVPRLVATLAALLLVTPAYAISYVDSTIAGLSGGRKYEITRDCVIRSEIGKLDMLPRGTIAAALDISPAVLVYTHQSVIASGHHRNVAGMHDVIDIFTLSPEQSLPILRRHNASYLAVCPNLIEPALFKRQGPHGLWAELAAGRNPAWLEPVRLPGAPLVKVWRIKPAR